MVPPLRSPLALTFIRTCSALAAKYEMQEFSWYKKFYPQPDQYCFNGCQSAVRSITYELPATLADEADYFVLQCSNTLQIKSLFHCAQAYCSYDEAVAGRSPMVKDCDKIGMSIPTIAQYLLSESELDVLPRINSTAALATAEAPLTSPVIPEREWAALGERTVKAFYGTWDLGFTFSFALIGFWALVILVGMAYRMLEMVRTHDIQPGVHKKRSNIWLWIRKKLILPATFGKHCQEATGLGTIPPRLETVLMVLYLVINFAFCFPGYELFIGNQYYASKKLQLARYVADRTGFLSIAQLPMVWVFAARNDPFLWLTGWAFATYNRFHRWIARISTAHAIVHSIAYSVYSYYSGTPEYNDYAAQWKAEYWYTGGIATIVMSLMMGASAYYFRARCYDLFLAVHIAMSLIFFVCLWYHVRIFNGEFAYFIWPCIAVWSIDRLLRIARTIYASIIPHFAKGTKATATYHPKTEMIRLDLTDFFPEKPIVPGHFYYLYIPNGLRGYESHPFTLCSWLKPHTTSPTSPSTTNKEFSPETRSLSESSTPDQEGKEISHTFLIRPYAGMTSRLQNSLLTNTNASLEKGTSTQQTIFLEGPYGSGLDLSTFSDVLILCGGSGITAAISHSNFLISKNSCTTKVHIIWAVPQRELVDDICGNELASAIQDDRVDMIVYLTGDAQEEGEEEEQIPGPEKLAAAARPAYEIRFGRPQIENVMREVRSMSTRNLAIVTCGTPRMADICRAAVVKILGEGEGVEIGWFNDSMEWHCESWVDAQ